MKMLSFLILFAFLSTNIFSQNGTASLGTSRVLPLDFWGVAGQNTIRDNINWRTEALLKKLPELHPMLLRYPGGDTGNWWDWKTGWFVPSNDFEKGSTGKLTKGPDKPEDFKTAVDRTGATPMWTINMITADIEDQLAMLRHLKTLGLSIGLVELGSEFYLQGNDLVQAKYLTGADYAKDANRWRDSINKYFPETKCAYVGAATKGNKPNRRNDWNTNVASAMQHPDAITIHVYPQPSTDKSTSDPNGNPIEILSEPFRAMDRLEQKDLKPYANVPEFWITEYNMNNGTAPIPGSWLHGIYIALLSMKFLEEPRITHTVFFTMCGKAGHGAIFTDEKGFSFGGGPKEKFIPPANPPATTPWSFTAAGYTLSIYGDALNGKTKATPVNFSNVPKLKCSSDGYSYAAVYGWKFSGSKSSDVLLLNLSSQPITVSTAGIVKSGSRYNEYYADAFTYIAKGNEMKMLDGTVSSTLELKPFSLTRISEEGSN